MDDQPVSYLSRGKRKTRQLLRKQFEKRRRDEEADRMRELLKVPCDNDIVLDGPGNVIKMESDNLDQVEQKPVVQQHIHAANSSANVENCFVVKHENQENEDRIINEEEILCDFHDEQPLDTATTDVPEAQMDGSQSILESLLRKPSIVLPLNAIDGPQNCTQVKLEVVEVDDNTPERRDMASSPILDARRDMGTSPVPDPELENLTSALIKLKLDVMEKENKNDKLLHRLKDTEDENIKFSEQLEKATEENAQYSKTVEQLLQDIELQNNSIKEKDDEILKTQKVVLDKEGDISKLNDTCNQKNEKIDNLNNAVSESNLKLQTANDALREEKLENKQLTKFLEECTAKAIASESELRKSETELGSKSAEIIRLQQVIQQLQSEKNSRESEMDDKTLTISNLTQRLEDATRELEDAEQEIAEAKGDNAELRKLLELNNTKVANVEKRLLESQSGLENKNKEITKLKDCLKAIELENEANLRMLRDKDAKIKKSDEIISNNQRAFEIIGDTLKENEAEIKRLKASLKKPKVTGNCVHPKFLAALGYSKCLNEIISNCSPEIFRLLPELPEKKIDFKLALNRIRKVSYMLQKWDFRTPSSFDEVLKVIISNCGNGTPHSFSEQMPFLRSCRLVSKSTKNLIDGLLGVTSSHFDLCEGEMQLSYFRQNFIPCPKLFTFNPKSEHEHPQIPKLFIDNKQLDPSYNPVPSRHVMIEIHSVPEIGMSCSENWKQFEESVTEFLTEFGQQMVSCTVAVHGIFLGKLERSMILISIRDWLKLILDIKSLAVELRLLELKPKEQRLMDCLEYPELKQLTTFQCESGMQNMFVCQLLKRNRHIQKLRFVALNDAPILLHISLPNLIELSARLVSQSDADLLRLPWKVKKLCLFIRPESDLVPSRALCSRLATIISGHGDTLEYLKIDIPSFEMYDGNCMFVKLKQLKHLHLRLSNRWSVENWSEFLGGANTLEHLTIELLNESCEGFVLLDPFLRDEKALWADVEKFHRENAWVNLPQLERVKLCVHVREDVISRDDEYILQRSNLSAVRFNIAIIGNSACIYSTN